MKSHYPTFRAGAAPGLVHKLGGLPWGLPIAHWPICRECGRAMSFLAQAPGQSAEANAPDLDIPAGEVLFAFKCEWDSICSFWESDGGANAVFSLPRAALGDAPTAPPEHAEDGLPELIPELGIAHWRIDDDGAPPELEADFYDYGRHDDLPDDIAHPHDWATEWRTKYNGVPYWTANGAQGVPPGRLLLQIDNCVPMQDGGYQEVANFCSDGTAFVFVDASQTPPTYSLLINR